MENLTGGNPPVRPLPCVVPCKLYFAVIKNPTNSQTTSKIMRTRCDSAVDKIVPDFMEIILANSRAVKKEYVNHPQYSSAIKNGTIPILFEYFCIEITPFSQHLQQYL